MGAAAAKKSTLGAANWVLQQQRRAHWVLQIGCCSKEELIGCCKLGAAAVKQSTLGALLQILRNRLGSFCGVANA